MGRIRSRSNFSSAFSFRPRAGQSDTPLDSGLHVLRVSVGNAGDMLGGFFVASSQIGSMSLLANLFQLHSVEPPHRAAGRGGSPVGGEPRAGAGRAVCGLR